MVFEHRYVDPDVAVEDRPVHLGVFEDFAVRQRNVAVIGLLVGRNDFRACGFGGIFDAAVFITFDPVVAGVVENRDLLGSGGQALFYDLGDQLGIGVAGQFGRFVPADIRFDGHFGPCFDELFHAAHFGDRFAEHGVRFAAHDGDQVGFSSRSGVGDGLGQQIHRSARLDNHRNPRQGDRL